MELRGRTALVTGSTSGIGLGIAHSLAAAGSDLILHGLLAPEAVVELVAEFRRRYGIEARFDGTDLGDGAAVETMMDRFGVIDILVNNAGIQHTAAVEDFPVERWSQILAINLTSSFHTIRRALPGMRERGWGRIVNIASVHGLVASANKSAYVAAKHGLVGLTKVVALETAGSGITCNAVCPGWVLTPLVSAQIEARAARESISIEQAGSDLLSEKQPSKEFVQPEELGALVAFLCSSAARSLTGTALPMDGGWTAR